MKSHIPANYVNPFELVAKGIENEHVYTKKSDIIFQDHEVTAFISAGQWRTTKGHVLVIPNEHFENIYGIPDSLLGKIHSLPKRIGGILALLDELHFSMFATPQPDAIA